MKRSVFYMNVFDFELILKARKYFEKVRQKEIFFGTFEYFYNVNLIEIIKI
jgi:hypothetical protein